MILLNSNWVAGFIDGDGSFALDTVGTFYRPSLSISQDDPQLLYKIKKFFGCGSVTQKNARSWHYRCRSAEQFKKYIIPKLGKAPFQTVKQYQYEIICNEAMPLFMDKSIPERKCHSLLQVCLEKIKNSRNIVYVNSNTPINEDWVVGFFEAEGHFSLRLSEARYVFISYKITQKNKLLLEKIQNFFGFGNVHSEGEGRSLKYSVEGIENVCRYGLPFFIKNPLKGKKNLQRVKFVKALRILSKENYRNDENLAKLSKLADDIIKIRER